MSGKSTALSSIPSGYIRVYNRIPAERERVLNRAFFGILSLLFLLSGIQQLFAGDKVVVAVTDTVVSGASSASGRLVSDILISSLIHSGRVEVKTRDDIRAVAAGIDNIRVSDEGRCLDGRCVELIAEKTGAEYVIDSRLKDERGGMLLSVTVLRLNGEVHVPEQRAEVSDSKGIIDAVRDISAKILNNFPLNGRIVSLAGDSTYIVNIGETQGVKPGDLLVLQGNSNIAGIIKAMKLYSLEVFEVQSFSSKVKVHETFPGGPEHTIVPGDSVTLATNSLFRAEDAGISEENSSNTEIPAKDKAESRRKSTDWEESLNSRSPFMRFSCGIPGNVRMGNDELDRYYGSGQGFMADFFPLRARDIYGDGFDILFRLLYRHYTMDDNEFQRFNDELPDSDDYMASKSDLKMFSGDIGFRYSLGTVILERFDFYILASFRYQYTMENAGSIRNSFWSYGASGGAGVEMTLFPVLGIFAEYNYGYNTIGADNKNVEGHQFYAGVTFRSGHY